MKSILIISFSQIKHDARVSRQITFLKSNYKVTVAAFGEPDDTELEFLKLIRPKLSIHNKVKLAFFMFFRWHKISYRLLYGHQELVAQVKERKFDLTIANDIETLPLAFQLGINKVLLDAHEYSPRQFEDKIIWRILFQPMMYYICKKYILQTVAMTTIGKGISKEYKKQFKCNPIVLNNAAWHNPIKESDIIPEKVRLVHHGGATISRQLEIMIEMMSLLDDRFTLDLMLIVPETASTKTKGYIGYLKNLASADHRISFLPPVKSKDVVPFINKYDMGIILVPPINFNYANGLPNKLFEFIQAKLAVSIGPIPEIAEVVNQYDLGYVSEEFTAQSLAAKLIKISNTDLIRFKRNAVKAATELSADKNASLLNEIVATSLNL
jgi:glycosyltransferase involved in cell wall biosynthesis